MLPVTLTKSQVKRVLNCTTHASFRRKVFTDEVITEHLRLTPAEFDRLRVFDTPTTRRICTYFNLTADSFTNIH